MENLDSRENLVPQELMVCLVYKAPLDHLVAAKVPQDQLDRKVRIIISQFGFENLFTYNV